MAQVSVNKISFSYGGDEDVFNDVSFSFDTTWKCGLVGRNGCGKTTFLNLLQNKFDYDGEISIQEEIEYFPFNISNKNKLTRMIVDEILDEYEQWRLDRELSLLKVDLEVLDRKFNTLSEGEQVKVMLAMLFVKDDKYLLIDEPTNHLDYEARILVADYLKSKDGFLLVSHDRNFLDLCIDHLIVMNKTNVEVRAGSFASWYADKIDEDNLARSKNLSLRKEIKRLDNAYRQSKRASDGIESTKYGHGVKNSSGVDRGFVGHKAAKKMKLAKNIERRKLADVEERKSLLTDVEEVDSLKMFNIKYRQNSLIQLVNATLAYGDYTVLENFNLHIKNEDIIKINGINGSGKSTIIKVLQNELEVKKGNKFAGSNLKISYVPQSAKNIHGSLFDLSESRSVDQSQLMSILAKMGFSRSHFYKDVSTFSEGQKKKVLLALSLCEEAHLYIWDEPLNYIDIFTRIQIEQLIGQYKPTLIFVEHDHKFCEKLVTAVINI